MAIYGIYKTEIEQYAKAGDWQMVKGLIAQSSDADPYKAEAEKKYGQQIAAVVINRPTHQAEIEAAARLGDYTKVEKLIADIPEGDPYKASMYGLFKDKFPSAAAFKSPVVGEAGFVNFPARIGTENNPEVERLVALYKKSYQEIIGEINDVTVASQAQRAASLRQIEKILTQLGVDTSTWIEDNIPVIYQQGMKQGLTQLEHMGAITIKNGKVVPAAAGAARAVSSGFTNINQEAVKALISDAQKSFGDALSTVNRSARQIFNQATQQAIKDRLATGEIAPLDRVKIANDIKQIVSDRGVAALTDKGGREWTLDRYAEMLTRTKVVEARNTGLSNKLAESGYDLVEVSSHGATDVCGDWEGKVLSLTGRTDGYPTVDDATADGLFHPNCEHAVNAIVPDLSTLTTAYNPDSGEYDDSFSLRPPHQAALEDAANSGDMKTVHSILSGMDKGDPYTQSMIDMFNPKLIAAGLPSLKLEVAVPDVNTNLAAKIFAQQKGLPAPKAAPLTSSQETKAAMDAFNRLKKK